jgi:microcin C transport system substrate-binding protein
MPDQVRHDGRFGVIGSCLRLAALLLFIVASFPAHARTDLITLSTAAQPPVGFDHLPYANPDAPKGGVLRLPGVGDFDNLNPFILRGTAPDTVLQIWQPLFKLSDTDSVTEYAELARSVVVRGNQVIFALDPRARFSDGVPVTAADVVWTYHTLITQGLPFYAAEYSQVAGVAAADARTVVFTLRPGAGPDTVFNLAGLYVLPAHFWAGRDFSAPLRDFPVGSGAYRVSAVDWGDSVTYSRVRGWWAAGIPADQGFDNFDTVTEIFFRDKSALLQAFKAGELDEHIEDSAALWDAARGWAPVRDGRVRLELVPETLPAGITGLVMNTRRPEFADARVRQALTLAFDAEWTDRALFGGFLRRERSYFTNSAMASSGLPSDDELKLLAPYRSQIPPAVFDAPFALPVTDGSGYNLPELKQAMALLNQAGWRVRDFALVDAAGQQMTFEILLDDPKYERIVIPYAHDLGLLGINATVRTVDPATYLRRTQNFDFDMTEAEFPVSDDPGSEQAGYWGCEAARRPGSENLAGVCAPAIDAMIAAEVAAPDAAAKRSAIHALDRLLLNGWYIVPWFSADSERLAYWQSRVAKPVAALQVGVDTTLWWAK